MESDGIHVVLTLDNGSRQTHVIPYAAVQDGESRDAVDAGTSVHLSTGELVFMEPEKAKTHHSTKRRKKLSRKQEEKLAEDNGGIRHNGSGAVPGYAGDVRVVGKYRIEAKYTTSKGYRVTRAELAKVRSECSLGESPLFAIDFRDPETQRVEDSWMLVPMDVWKEHIKDAPTDD